MFCVSFLFSLHLHYKHIHVYVNKKFKLFFFAHFFKKLFVLKRARKRLFKRLLSVFGSSLITYS
nr:MAG TPA: hypothetical protein [Caudoviricetes sp.]